MWQVEEQAALALGEQTQKGLLKNNQQLLERKKIEIREQSQALATQQAVKADLEKKIQILMPLQDGDIISNGCSDFTRAMETYVFSIGEQKFQILDVPGIEGDEEKVRATIETAVKKAHAIFYVTRRPTPPGSGSDGKEGTIDKIRRQLGNQTEVWTIYNKSITSPTAFQDDGLVNVGEKESLKAMEKSLKESLGNAYSGCMVVSAMPAFYALSTCLLPGTSNYKNKQKFLNKMTSEELLHRSGLAEFLHFIRDDISTNYKNKIQKANLNKIGTCLDEGISILAEAIQKLSQAADAMEQQNKSTASQLDSLLESTQRGLKSMVRDQLSQKKIEIRSEIYAHIDENISNGDFKAFLENRIESLKSEIGPIMESQLASAIKKFQIEIEEMLEKYKEKVNEIIEYNINNKFEKMSLNFKMSNGINIPGLLSSIGGGVLLVWYAFLSTNPVGWTIGTILAALGLAVGIVKSLIGAVNKKYKINQQKEITDKNLKNILMPLKKI